MDNRVQTEDLKLMPHDDIVARGWTMEKFSANMNDRLNRVRGENTDENFLLRYNYNKNNANCCQA